MRPAALYDRGADIAANDPRPVGRGRAATTTCAAPRDAPPPRARSRPAAGAGPRPRGTRGTRGRDDTGRERTTSVTGVLRGGSARRRRRRARSSCSAPTWTRCRSQELADVEYRSEVDGVMHACGHDLHTAMLVGAARLLDARRDELPGDVVLMFQPGEEGWAGAKVMIEEGVLDAAGRRADAAYGMHVFSTMARHGTFVTKARPDAWRLPTSFTVTVKGSRRPRLRAPCRSRPGARGLPRSSAPCRSPRPAPSTPTTRSSSRSASCEAGTRRNVIPDEAHLEATVRSFSTVNRDQRCGRLPSRRARGRRRARAGRRGRRTRGTTRSP